MPAHQSVRTGLVIEIRGLAERLLVLGGAVANVVARLDTADEARVGVDFVWLLVRQPRTSQGGLGQYKKAPGVGWATYEGGGRVKVLGSEGNGREGACDCLGSSSARGEQEGSGEEHESSEREGRVFREKVSDSERLGKKPRNDPSLS